MIQALIVRITVDVSQHLAIDRRIPQANNNLGLQVVIPIVIWVERVPQLLGNAIVVSFRQQPSYAGSLLRLKRNVRCYVIKEPHRMKNVWEKVSWKITWRHPVQKIEFFFDMCTNTWLYLTNFNHYWETVCGKLHHYTFIFIYTLVYMHLRHFNWNAKFLWLTKFFLFY